MGLEPEPGPWLFKVGTGTRTGTVKNSYGSTNAGNERCRYSVTLRRAAARTGSLQRPQAHMVHNYTGTKQSGKRDKEVNKCRCYSFTFVTVGGTKSLWPVLRILDGLIRIHIQEGKNDPQKYKKNEEISFFEMLDVLMAEGTLDVLEMQVLHGTDLAIKDPISGFMINQDTWRSDKITLSESNFSPQ